MSKLKLTSLSLSIAIALGGTSAMASAFQIWEQDAAGIGEDHAGGAAKAQTASTEWYNPAGMVMIKQKQISTGITAVHTNIPFKGTIDVDTLYLPKPKAVNGQAGGMNYVPNFHYVQPLEHGGAFGFGINVPFGLQTDWGDSNFIRYAGTLTSIQAIDFTPSLAFPITPKVSFGFGVDLAYVTGEFDQYAGTGNIFDPTEPATNGVSKNKGTGLAPGFHTGLLWQVTPSLRMGLAYHSPLSVHLSGTSTLSGALAKQSYGGNQTNHNLFTDFKLPGWTELSVFDQLTNRLAVMGSATYTKWSVFNKLELNNVVGINSDSVKVTVIEDYKNTWNYAIGTHYQLTDKWMLKAGLGYDQSPANDAHRNVQLPDADRMSVSTGVQYKATKNLAFDLGYMHIFVDDAKLDVSQKVDTETVTTKGNSNGSSADVLGAQVTWSF